MTQYSPIEHLNGEAKGAAHVHVVIVGFSRFDSERKLIFDYVDENNPAATEVRNISPYLLAGEDDDLVKKLQRPLCSTPLMRCGSKPSDGGNLVLNANERKEIPSSEPELATWIRLYLGSKELINGLERYCFWLDDISPKILRESHAIRERIGKVRDFRLNSTAAPTRAAAETPSLFFYRSLPTEEYIAIPEVSSENRQYVPIAMLPPETVASNKLYLITSSSRYIFGVLISSMHMAWMRTTTGRMKSDYQYSGTIVYNTFPWPEDPTDKQRNAVERAAQAVLDTREQYPDSTLADLYDPLSMPAPLAKAHAKLDRAVEKCYRSQLFPSERHRVEFLFKLYQKLIQPLLPTDKKKRRAKSCR